MGASGAGFIPAPEALYVCTVPAFLVSYSPARIPIPSTMHHLSQSSSKVARRVVGGSSATRVARRYAHKDVKFSNEGRASILAGVDVLANAVSVTLGPKGLFHPFCGAAPGVDRQQGGTSLSSSRMAALRLLKVCPPLAGSRSHF